MSSGSKKRRTESEGDVEKELLDALIQICADMNDSSIILTPLKIECCNATSSHAASFSKAFCDTKPYDTRVLFGDVFRNGISILRDFEVSKKIPKEKQTLFVFNKLMDLLKGGTELTVLVANHLLGKLATSSCYLVDKNCNGKKGDQCFCGEDSCTMTGTYGDTSIGNPEVWHGNLDIINNNDLAVESLDEQPDTPETPGEKSPVESVSNFYDTFHKGDYCNDVTNYIPEFGIIVGLLPLQGNAVYSTKSHRVTVVGSSTINHLINIYIGTDSGYVLQISKWIQETQCGRYSDNCLQCMDVKDANCGWCVTNTRCSTKMECTSLSPDYWLPSVKNECLSLEFQNHPSGFAYKLDETNAVSVNLSVTFKPPLKTNYNMRCRLGGRYIPTVIVSDKIQCTIEPSDDRNFTDTFPPVTACPQILSQNVSIPTGRSRTFVFRGNNLKVPKDFIYWCKVEGSDINQRDQMILRHKHTEREESTYIEIKYGPCGTVPLDVFDGAISLYPYKCESLSPNKKDCSTCHYLNKSMGYECQWCQSSGCVDIDNDQCRRAETCGGPVVTKISPKDGPPEGGTVVTIEGFNFGIQSFVTVTVAGVPCNHATFIGRK
uniref:Plexin-B2 n=1 Tax=Magallana gigas TaxID=29159 RepID=K1R650_MAGGI